MLIPPLFDFYFIGIILNKQERFLIVVGLQLEDAL